MPQRHSCDLDLILPGRGRKRWTQAQSNPGPCALASLGAGAWPRHSGNPLVAPFKAMPPWMRPNLTKYPQNYFLIPEPSQNMGCGWFLDSTGRPGSFHEEASRVWSEGPGQPTSTRDFSARFSHPVNGDEAPALPQACPEAQTATACRAVAGTSYL